MKRAIVIAGLVACSSHDDIPADAPLPACDYIEAGDTTNGTTAEPTGVAIGSITRDVCGTVETGHFDAVTHAVDVDTFRVTLPAPADLRVQFFGGPGVEAVADFTVLVFDTAANPTLLNGGRIEPAMDHGVFVASLPAGDYDVVVTAKAAADLAAAVDYKVRIHADDLAGRCAIPTKAADFTEAGDGADSHGNDVVAVDYAAMPPYTPISGVPEASGLSTDARLAVRLAGASADVTGPDRYLDRDTFTFQTGKTTNELAIRLAWPVPTADLDYLVFADGSTTRIAGSTRTGGEGEFATFAVKPATTYQLWIAAQAGSTGMPVPYDAALCGDAVSVDVSR